MKKTAVICEINPYHNGHRYIFDRAREGCGDKKTLVIAVMSGNFTQRGIPAVLDKYTRAGILVTPSRVNGISAADLVVELPFPWCASGAEAFAVGGVAVALGMGAEEVVCGSEIGDTETIRRAAVARDSEEYLRRLMTYEKESERGEGSAVLNDRVMREMGFCLDANDKLAAEYARNLPDKRMLRVYPRISGEDTPYKSATDLRSLMYGGDVASTEPYVSPEAFDAYMANAAHVVTLSRYHAIAHTFCRLFSDPQTIYAEGGGGLWARITAIAASAGDPEVFFAHVGTKKYTDARIRRSILFAMTKVVGEQTKTPPPFTVLLAANGRGRAYLSELRKTGVFPIITKPSDVPEEVLSQYRSHATADGLYTLCMEPPVPADEYMKKHPVILP